MGLSCALLLRQAGYPVRICAEHFPPATTSNVAPAFWHPYRVFPADRVQKWATSSYQQFIRLSQDEETGVVRRFAYEWLRKPSPLPLWHNIVDDFRLLEPRELSPAYQAGYHYQTFVIETPRYMQWLLQQVKKLGAEFELRKFEHLEIAVSQAPVVINCSGVGAASLVPDTSVVAVRGQVVRVANPGLEHILLDEQHPEGTTYMIPRSNDCVLGGTTEEDQWELTVNPATTEAILRRCQVLEPRLKGVNVLDVAVGLRPCRPSVRLESERAENGTFILHNYGHGGGGITLSWGCAQAVVETLEAKNQDIII